MIGRKKMARRINNQRRIRRIKMKIIKRKKQGKKKKRIIKAIFLKKKREFP